MLEQATSHHDTRMAYEFIQTVRHETGLQLDIQSLADLEELANQRGIHLTSPNLRQAFRQDWLMRRLTLHHQNFATNQE
jgi:hypothetical protein